MKNTLLSRPAIGAWVLLLLGTAGAAAQTTYTWSGANGSNWSAATNWGGSGVPSAGDTANIADAASNMSINYDTGASGTLGTLNLTQSASAFTETLKLLTSLTLTGGGSIYSLKGSTGATTIQLNGTSTLTIASGASFTVGTNSSSLFAATGSQTNYISTASGYTGSGVLINGALNFVTASTSTVTLNESAPMVLGAGGTLNVDSEAAGGTRLVVMGNFTTSASANTIAATSSNGNAAKGLLYLQGSTVTIGSGTTFSGFNDGTGGNFGIYFYQTAAGTQTVSLGSITGFGIRNASGTAATTVTKVSSSATSGAISNAIASFQFLTAIGGDSMTLQLGSNLNFVGGSYTTPFYFSLAGTAITSTIDLNGFTYDATAGTSTTTFAPTGTSATNSDYIAIVNSGASSISGGQGIFKAAAFGLGSGADVGIGAGVILQATAGGGVNDLGNKDATATTTIDPTSTFYYTGTGTAATLKSTNNRTVGGILVGTGSSASTLQFKSAITAAGNVTPNAGATLDLGGFGLALTGSASLTGAGTITNSSTTTVSAITFASGATGGLSPGGQGVAATLSFTAPTKAITVSLANSTSVFDVTSAGLGAGTFDSLSLSNTTLDLTGGAFYINFGSGTYNGSIQLVSLANGSTITGSLASLTSNLGASETLSLSSTGLLTFSAVPEPSETVLLLAGAAALGVLARRRLARAV